MGGAGVASQVDIGVWRLLMTSGDAVTALTNVKAAISMLAGSRADVGANMSRYEAYSSALSVQKDNVGAARSRIADVDVAVESANFARQQILVHPEQLCLLRPTYSAVSAKTHWLICYKAVHQT